MQYNIHRAVQGLVLGFALSILTLPNLSAQSYDLSECIELALRHSPEYQRGQLRIERSRQQLERSRHNYLPTVQTSLGQSWDFGRSVDKTGVMNDRSSMGTSFSLGASYTLFSGFARLHDIKASKLQIEAAVAELDDARQSLAMQVVQYYYACLHAKGVLSTARRQYERGLEQRTYAEALHKSGRWAKDKLLEAEAAEAQDRQNVLQAEGSLREAELRLMQLMQVDTLSLRTAPEEDAMREAHRLEDEAKLLGRESLGEQASLRANHYQQLATKEQVKQIRAGYLPTLSLSAGYSNNYYRIMGSAYAGFNISFAEQLRQNGRSYIGLNLSVPIFDAFRTRSQVRQAKLNLRDLQFSYIAQERQLHTELQKARLSAELARLKIEAVQATLRANRSAEELARESWRAGRLSTNELSIARSRSFVAEVELLNAKSDYLLKCQLLSFYLQPQRK